MSEIKLTHLQRRRLEQLEMGSRGQWRVGSYWITSHWNSSKAANQALCVLGLAERYGQSWHYPSGKVASVGDVRITQAGHDFLASPTSETAS